LSKATPLAAVSVFLITVVTADAQGWEVSFLAGWTAPSFEEEFVYDPNLELPNIPGGSIHQEGVFRLKAGGSFAFGGSVAYFFNRHVAVEGRVDTIDLGIDTLGPRFEAAVPVVPGFSATAVLDVGNGTINVERLFPLSLNLKVRTGGGTARFVASGGLSYLPRVRFDAFQPVSLAIGGTGLPLVEIARVVLEAGAIDSGESRWGFNGGAGVEFGVAPNVSIVGEVRLHSFQPQAFVWESSGDPTLGIEERLVEALVGLPPGEVQLLYFQATGGVAFRF
jgi:opacity protein-like surface antigen